MTPVPWYQGRSIPCRGSGAVPQMRREAFPPGWRVTNRAPAVTTTASTATAMRGPRLTRDHPPKVPMLVTAPEEGAAKTDEVSAACHTWLWTAWAHARKPPGWTRIRGTNHSATEPTVATTAVSSWPIVRTLATTAMAARRTKAGRTDRRTPAASPKASTATTPWAPYGRARRARMIRRAAAKASTLYVETVAPANHDTGAEATRPPAATPTKRPPRAVPATQVRPAAAADNSAATRTRLWTGLRPVTT